MLLLEDGRDARHIAEGENRFIGDFVLPGYDEDNGNDNYSVSVRYRSVVQSSLLDTNVLS